MRQWGYQKELKIKKITVTACWDTPGSRFQAALFFYKKCPQLFTTFGFYDKDAITVSRILSVKRPRLRLRIVWLKASVTL